MPARPTAAGEGAPPSLVIRLRRISPTHHGMEVVRADGTRESLELETRSCLLHDLVHFALESVAGLANSFFGRLARGVAYDDLAQDNQDPGGADELLGTEQVVGPLQGAWRVGLEPAAFVTTFRAYQASIGRTCPPWLDEDLVTRFKEHLHRLEGEWRATAFGQVMELRFEVPPAPPAA